MTIHECQNRFACQNALKNSLVILDAYKRMIDGKLQRLEKIVGLLHARDFGVHYVVHLVLVQVLILKSFHSQDLFQNHRGADLAVKTIGGVQYRNGRITGFDENKQGVFQGIPQLHVSDFG